MKILPVLEDIKKIAQTGEYKVLPVSSEILSDICTPIEAMKILSWSQRRRMKNGADIPSLDMTRRWRSPAWTGR